MGLKDWHFWQKRLVKICLTTTRSNVHIKSALLSLSFDSSVVVLFVTGVEQFRTEQIELSRTRLIRAKLYQIDQDQIVPD